MSLARVRQQIAAAEQAAAREAARRPLPPPPDWVLELGVGAGRPPTVVHVGDCTMSGKRRKPATADQARRALVEGVAPCAFCRPDTALGVLE